MERGRDPARRPGRWNPLTRGVARASVCSLLLAIAGAPGEARASPLRIAGIGASSPSIREAQPETAEPTAGREELQDDERPAARDEPGQRPAERSLTIAAVEVSGRRQVSPRQIKNILAREGIGEGAVILWPEDERVERARARLVATGYFSRVTMRMRAVEGDQEQVRLIIELVERGSLTIESLYAANSRLTPFHGGLELLERNFLGRRIHVGAGGIWGTLPRNQGNPRLQHGYKLLLELPDLAKHRFGLLTTLYYLAASDPYRVAGARDDPNPQLFDTVNFDRIGGVAGFTLGFGGGLALGIDYRLEGVDATVPDAPLWVRPDGGEEALDLDLADGDHLLSSMDFSLGFDARDLGKTIDRGGRIRIDVQLSSPAIGSRYEYVKVVLGGAYTFRLPWGHWLTPSALGGQISGDAPRFERFHPGDFADWTPGRDMGLVYSTRLPVDVFGSGVDGQGLSHFGGRADLEYAVPLFRRARTRFVHGGHFFLSTGVFVVAGSRDERRSRLADGLRVAPLGYNANLGVRLDTAIGRIGLSVGNILERLPL